VPLSEEELRLLEQMEHALAAEDPKFASTLRGTSLRRSARRRAIAAGVVFVLGIVMLMGGVMIQSAVGFAIGIAGFVVMLASATVALTSMRGQQHATAAADPRTAMHPSRGFTVIDGGRAGKLGRKGRTSARTSGSFMERMEERWRRRREQGGF
jgi:hypothetical protein